MPPWSGTYARKTSKLDSAISVMLGGGAARDGPGATPA